MSALVLTLVFVALVSAARCSSEEIYRVVRGGDGEECAVVATWGSAAERAAAALFLQALRRARYEPRLLRLQPRAAPAPHTHHQYTLALGSALSVAMPRGYHVAPSALPVAAQLHVRRAPAARKECAPNDTSAFHNNSLYLKRCAFHRDGKEAVVYVLDEWTDFGKALESRSDGLDLKFEWNVSRRELTERVRAGAASFLFVDAALWPAGAALNVSRVLPACAPAPAHHGTAPVHLTPSYCSEPLHPVTAFRYIEEKYLEIYGPSLFTFFNNFTVKPDEIREFLEFEWNQTDTQLVANTWLDRNKARAADWNRIAAEQHIYWTAVHYCMTDADKQEYDWMLNAIISHNILNFKFIIKARYDCEISLSNHINKIAEFAEFLNLLGVVSVGGEVMDAASNAEERGVPLVAGNAAGGGTVGAPAGSPRLLAAALRRLLHECRWTRLLLLYENTPFSTALNDELRKYTSSDLEQVSDSLAIKEIEIPRLRNGNDTTDLKNRLRLLAEQHDAHIFMINAAPMAANSILEAASELRLTLAGGYVWVVREGARPRGAGSEHFALALAPRGPGAHEPADPRRAALLSEMETRWSGRLWPRYAVPIVDAILTLTEGFHLLTEREHKISDNIRTKGYARAFWENLENKTVMGLFRPLQYRKRIVSIPFVYLEYWNASGDGQIIKYWRPPEDGYRFNDFDSNDSCPAVLLYKGDGSRSCVWPSGRSFDQYCKDDLLWGFLGCLLVIVILCIAAILRYKRPRSKSAEASRQLWNSDLQSLKIIKRDAIEVCHVLGEGQYGRVWLARLRERGVRAARLVAVKALRSHAPLDEESEFVREATILAKLNHDHIVAFVGVCDKGGPPLLVMEHAFFGDLLQYLRNRRHLAEDLVEHGQNTSEESSEVSAAALTRLARDAAEALAYLAGQGIVHRDLRAANCLVDAKRSLKLGDFGMARSITESAQSVVTEGKKYYSRQRALFPVLWMAPESLSRGVFSSASDVWSLGVLCVELMTLGERPFGTLPALSVMRAVLEGGQAPLPRSAGAAARALTAQCWQRDAATRPSAARLARFLTDHPHALPPALDIHYITI